MYTYRKRGRLGAGSIFFMVLFIISTIVLGILLYLDKGRFWDILPLVSIPILVISLALIIFNFVRRTSAGYLFIFFFLIFLCGLLLSSLFGPFAINRKAQMSFNEEKYTDSIIQYSILLENYPNSRFAGGALKNISLAYYNSGQYVEAVKSFDESIGQALYSYDELEIKNIYIESHQKIAENNYNNGSYLISSEHYLKAVDALEDLINTYPETNEAFIAAYKIPEFLFNAATSYLRMEDYEQEIKVFENLVENYVDSDYHTGASSLLFTAYTNNAVRLVDEKKYSEGIEELLKTFDIDGGNGYFKVYGYKKDEIFYDVPVATTKNIAGNLLRAGEYEKALFLYEALMEYYPGTGSGITADLVKSKLGVVAGASYTEIEQTDPERRINNPENCIIIIENNTSYSLTLYIGGPEYKIVNIITDSELEIEIKPGEYEVAAELVHSNILPYYGMIIYEENLKYREIYSILEE